MVAQKVAVTGDINGQIEIFFSKLAVLQQRQNFAFVIIAGNLFGSDESNVAQVTPAVENLIAGKIEIPVPVYFTLGRQLFSKPILDKLTKDNGELCPNLFAIGRRGQVKTSDNVRLVAISGRHEDDAPDRPQSVYAGGYTDKDATSCISYNHADIFITSDWPAGITIGSNVACSGAPGPEHESIANVCSALKPRYHFSTSSTFYEREPFFHVTDSDGKPITRFIALAPFGNSASEKWIYAFSIDPEAEIPTQLPAGVRASPFAVKKRKLDSQSQAFNQFRYAKGDDSQHDGHRGKRRRHAAPTPQQCYFCLSNPMCETHMIASIGDESYITVAKGPLPTRDTFPDLGVPGHMLIVPLTHAPTLASIPDADTAARTLAEMSKFRDAIRKMVESSSLFAGKAKLGTVSWDISRAGGVHNHWQILPVPVKLIESGAVENAFKEQAQAIEYPEFITEAEAINTAEEGSHLSVEIWSNGTIKKMVLPLDEGFVLDLQFPRRVLEKLLGLSGRANWKDCGQSKTDEEADAARVKQLFKEFDFTLSE